MTYKYVNGRTLIGLLEPVTIQGGDGKQRIIMAKIDTGASKSSLDENLTKQLGLGPVLKSRLIKSAHGSKFRPIIEVDIEIAKKALRAEFTIVDRSHMAYQVLIGQNILKHGFLIDPVKHM
ncbi:ATP-dependent zinc protease [Candidatus Woesearchaeota archaeon]|nr:ATP-dependent zinc protease [Candidatus Woesearchaeota archaeon]